MAMNPGLAAYIAKKKGGGNSNLKDAAAAKMAPTKAPSKGNPFAAAAAAKLNK